MKKYVFISSNRLHLSFHRSSLRLYIPKYIDFYYKMKGGKISIEFPFGWKKFVKFLSSVLLNTKREFFYVFEFYNFTIHLIVEKINIK